MVIIVSLLSLLLSIKLLSEGSKNLYPETAAAAGADQPVEAQQSPLADAREIRAAAAGADRPVEAQQSPLADAREIRAAAASVVGIPRGLTRN